MEVGFRHSHIENWLMILSPSDQRQYHNIRDSFGKPRTKASPSRRFPDCLDQIHRFVIQGNADDQKRGFACGFYPRGNLAAINTKYLKAMTQMSKAAVNKNLVILGYNRVRSGSEKLTLSDLFRGIGVPKGEFNSWTLRMKTPPAELDIFKESLSGTSSEDDGDNNDGAEWEDEDFSSMWMIH
jgi:hypothetical protein